MPTGRFEFDPSWVVIRMLMLLRLARVVGDTEKLRSVSDRCHPVLADGQSKPV